MAPCEITDDYYLILKIPQNATFEEVKKSYWRLAKALHPDKNLDKPDATASFQFLVRAYETISDPDQRRIYDIKYEGIRLRKAAQEESLKRDAEAAKTAQTKAAEEKAKRQKEQEEQAASVEKLRHLEGHRSNYDSQIFELNRVIRKLGADLQHLQEKDDEAVRKEREKNGWWAYFTSPIYGKPAAETEEQKQGRQFEAIQRENTKRIKEQELAQRKAKLQTLETHLRDTNAKIAAAKQNHSNAKRAEEARKQEKIRKEHEAKRQADAQQERERLAKWWEAEMARRRKEQAAKEAQEAQEAQEAKEAQERATRAAREAREKLAAQQRARAAAREAQEAEEAQQRAQAAQQRAARAAREAKQAAASRNESKAKTSKPRASTSKRTAPCRHAAFWPKVQGAQLCSQCHAMQKRFAFQCPGCEIIACANCRQGLRGEKVREKRISNMRGAGTGMGHSYGYEYDYYDYD